MLFLPTAARMRKGHRLALEPLVSFLLPYLPAQILTLSGSSRPQDGKPPGLDEDPRQKLARDEGSTDGASPAPFNSDVTSGQAKDDQETQAPEVVDPLAGMPAVDKWGIKGLRTLMNNYPDYHAMVVGMDPTSLGLDISSQEYVGSAQLLQQTFINVTLDCFRRKTIHFLMTHLLGQRLLLASFDCRIVTM